MTLLIFASGALVGILSFARVVAWALEHQREKTTIVLIGLVVGALLAPDDRVLVATLEWTAVVTAGLLGWGVLGAVAVLGLDAMTDEITY